MDVFVCLLGMIGSRVNGVGSYTVQSNIVAFFSTDTVCQATCAQRGGELFMSYHWSVDGICACMIDANQLHF